MIRDVMVPEAGNFTYDDIEHSLHFSPKNTHTYTYTHTNIYIHTLVSLASAALDVNIVIRIKFGIRAQVAVIVAAALKRPIWIQRLGVDG